MKTKKYYLIVLFSCFLVLNESITFAQSGWFQIATVGNPTHLYGVYFVDVNTGIIDQFKTTNGGINWVQTNFFSGLAMNFPTQIVGYRVASGISKTTNAGDNWFSQPNPGDLLLDVDFVNSNTGYACGNAATIIKTTNGGSNWTLVTPPVSSSHYLNGVFFTEVNIGFICGYTTSGFPSVILKTTNGGVNWSVQNFPSGTGYNSIFFVNANTGIVIGEKAAKTTNAGATWVEKNQSVTTFQHSLYFSSVNTGYSTGFSGNIIKTSNGGETWYRQTSGTGSDLESVYFLNDNTGFVCGDNGVVLKTTDGGGPPLGIKPVSNQVPGTFSLYQNYPNPFNPSTRIKFDVPANVRSEKSNVKIVIYDMLGKEMGQLVDFDFSAGTYEVEWEASDYPSGVYFYTLTAGSGFKETKRMVLLK